MTNSEAIHNLYGEISTERDGDLTHQCIQTNLADVICGGNPNDKIIYPRSAKRRSASFPTPRSLERRHSLRLFGSTKRLQRCQSTKSLSKNTTLRPNQSSAVTDSSSSEYQSTDSSSPSNSTQAQLEAWTNQFLFSTEKSASLLSRIFRRSCRSTKKVETYSAQFPPHEWFNSKAVHLQSVGTQTMDHNVSAERETWRFLIISNFSYLAGYPVERSFLLRWLWNFTTFLDTTAPPPSSQSLEWINLPYLITRLLADPTTVAGDLLWRKFTSIDALNTGKIAEANASE